MKALTRQEEQIMLAICHLNENAYLVSIREKLQELTGKTLDVGTIYIPLKRLKERGHLDTSMGEPTGERGGKAIQFYHLTPQGSQALSALKAQQMKLWEGLAL